LLAGAASSNIDFLSQPGGDTNSTAVGTTPDSQEGTAETSKI